MTNHKSYLVHHIEHTINNSMRVIGSKSLSHRALILASLSHGKSILENISECDDVLVTKQALMELGITIESNGIYTIVQGNANVIHDSPKLINFKDSGTSYRFFMALASFNTYKVSLLCSKQMEVRPIKELADVLSEGGCTIEYTNIQGYPPVNITGPFVGGQCQLSISRSSQFASALLLIAPLIEKGIEMTLIGESQSKPYLVQTLSLMELFGVDVQIDNQDTFRKITVNPNQPYLPHHLQIEGDYSGAAYFFAAGAILGGQIEIMGLSLNSLQGDKYILDCLQMMGCTVQKASSSIILKRNPDTPLQALDLDMGDYPDLVLPLSIVAIYADGPTTFRNISHLKYKESDRLLALTHNLTKLNVKSEIKENNILTIYPNSHPSGGFIDSFNDHRIVMSFAIAGLKIPGIILENPQCVRKSYPNFFNHIQQIGGE